MAKGKKSFILYADQRGVFDKLSNEQAGTLIKHIFSYVSDENPEGNLITEIAFELIKQQLKRDLDHWENIKLKRSEAGKASAKSRSNKLQQTSTHVKSVQQTSTNPTVNVNGNVTVNDILLEKETKELLQIWVSYRKEIKKPIKSQSIEAISKKINENGFEKSKKIINYSIENGYQGLFWDKDPAIKKKNNFGLNDVPDDFVGSDQSLVKAEFDRKLKILEDSKKQKSHG